jgi:hypothetical protein
MHSASDQTDPGGGHPQIVGADWFAFDLFREPKLFARERRGSA